MEAPELRIEGALPHESCEPTIVGQWYKNPERQVAQCKLHSRHTPSRLWCYAKAEITAQEANDCNIENLFSDNAEPTLTLVYLVETKLRMAFTDLAEHCSQTDRRWNQGYRSKWLKREHIPWWIRLSVLLRRPR